MNDPINVFLDSNIFIREKYNFDSNGNLGKLKGHANDGRINLFISNIVQGEVNKHLTKDVKKFIFGLRNARKVVNPVSILRSKGVASLFEAVDNNELPKEIVLSFEDYLRKANVEVLDNGCVDCDQIVSDYFLNKPPFGEKKNKKCEFPDAIIISRLKSLFSPQNKLYVISGDKLFCEALPVTEGFTVLKSIKHLFDLMNRDSYIYKEAKKYMAGPNNQKTIKDMLTKKLYDEIVHIDGLDCDRKGYCEGYNYHFVEVNDVSQMKYTLDTIDDIKKDTVNLTLSCEASLAATCYYDDESNSVWDSEDRCYMYLHEGSVEERHEFDFNCKVVLAFKSDKGPVNFQVKSLNFDVTLDCSTRVKRLFVDND